MPNPNPALLPSPALFDVTTVAKAPVEGTIERVALEDLELAPNPRKHITHDSIHSLAGLLMRTGQLIPCIGHRPDPDQPTVLLYDGQRRLLAAKASHELAGTDGFEGLAPVRTLIVLLLDHEPTPDEIRRIQAQANQREELSLQDQQQQFADCWHARAGLPDDDRVLAVCADLGITPKRAHNLRRQLTLPEPIRERVAERPNGHQLSVTMANRLADMHEIAPDLTQAVAKRITSTDLHDSALRDLGAFVHRTIVEDEHTYAVRIDDGAMLDAAEHIERARTHLTATEREQLAHDPRLRTGQGRPRARHAHRPRQDQGAQAHDHTADPRPRPRRTLRLRPPARTGLRRRHLGRQPPVHHRPRTRATRQPRERPARPRRGVLRRRRPRRRRAACRRTGRPRTPQRAAPAPSRGNQQQPRARPRPARRAHGPHARPAARAQSDHLPPPRQALPRRHRLRRRLDNQDRQQPIGDTGRREPRQPDAILDAELERALNDPDPLRGIAQLTASWASAFALDPDGVTRTKTLGTDRMARKLADALPGGHSPLRAAVWEFLRPMLSPRLATLHRDTFVFDEPLETTVELAAHRGESDLADLDLGDDAAAA